VSREEECVRRKIGGSKGAQGPEGGGQRRRGNIRAGGSKIKSAGGVRKEMEGGGRGSDNPEDDIDFSFNGREGNLSEGPVIKRKTLNGSKEAIKRKA